MAESSTQRHPTGGRRRKIKGPALQQQLPDLPPLPQGGESSEELEEEKRQNGHGLPLLFQDRAKDWNPTNSNNNNMRNET